jgi:hypothetical protein
MARGRLLFLILSLAVVSAENRAQDAAYPVKWNPYTLEATYPLKWNPYTPVAACLVK